MSNGNNFLTIPSQECLFTAIRDARSAGGDSSSPVEDEDDEETDDASRLIPRSSPVPRRRGLSIFDETAEYMKTRLALPSRRVSFADTTGRELVKVKEFVAFESDEEDDERKEDAKPYSQYNTEPIYVVCPEFQVPSKLELLLAVRTNKVEVESVSFTEDEPLTCLGLIRVLNISFHKAVYVRFTMDGWSTFFDYPAEYVNGSNDVETDQFSFKLSFAQPYLYPGSRIEFVVRFETPQGDYWANKGGKNYAVVLNLTQKHESAEPKEMGGETIKGILKAKNYRPEAEYDETLAMEKEEEDVRSTEAEMNVSREPVPPSQIFHPEIDIENIDVAVSSSPNESCSNLQTEGKHPEAELLKEQPLKLIVAREFQDLTASPTNQPLITQTLVGLPRTPGHKAFVKGWDEGTFTMDAASSFQHGRDSSNVDERETPCIVQPILSIFSQAAESDSQTTAVDKVPLGQHEIQVKSAPPLSVVMLDSDKDSETLDTERMDRERNVPPQEQTITSPCALEPQDIAYSSTGSEQEEGRCQTSHVGDAVDRSGSGSLDMQVPLLRAADEPEKIPDVEEGFTGEEAISVDDGRMSIEGTQASVGEQPDVVTSLTLHATPTASSGLHDGGTQIQKISPSRQMFSPLLPSMPLEIRQDPVCEVDGSASVSTGGSRSLRPFPETLPVAPYQFTEVERCSENSRNEVASSPYATADVLSITAGSLGATTSVSLNDMTIVDKDISVDNVDEMFAHNLERATTTPQDTDANKKGKLSQTQQPVLDSPVSELTVSEVAIDLRRLVTAFVALEFTVCLMMIIINRSILLIIGLYLMLRLL